ncbi:MAG: sigma 54-interacting transcriptional regulator [Rhodocyclaceae bacterium]|nr:sigma 54-interacting transcriptional regulator [Rhodocyclaceae bacterium]
MNAAEAIRSGAHVLVVDDDPDLLRLLTMRLSASGYQVTTAASAAAAEAQLANVRPDVVVSDVRLPDRDGLSLFSDIRRHHPSLPVIMLTAHGTIPDAVEAIGKGVFAYLTKPFDSQVLREKIEHALSLAPRVEEPRGGDERWRAEIVSRSNEMRELLAEAHMVAASDASILIRGDSGTGKELLARAIHRASPRAGQPFVAINCGAIPEQLLESELFGHVKGAFTGASSNRDGLFLAANGGSLFLDEIGDMPLPLQVKLLRVLQERAVRPVGATQARPIDVRILSATHRDLDAAMGEGQFREDLYYRLNVVSLHLPPLASRREDIPLLASHFLTQLANKYGKDVNGFAPDALDALVGAPWPGNVRQLFNVIEQVCALATSPLIPRSLVDRALRVRRMDELSYAEAKARFERDYLIQLLKLTDGNVSDAARLAQRNRTEFYRLLQRYDLVPAMFRSGTESVGHGRHG